VKLSTLQSSARKKNTITLIFQPRDRTQLKRAEGVLVFRIYLHDCLKESATFHEVTAQIMGSAGLTYLERAA
jgi:hypothetical protein